MPTSFEERLLKLMVPEPNSGCWLWIGYTTRTGYALFSMNGKLQSVHRYSYRHFKGEIPIGMQVCHRCDVRNCVNPDHLFLGSNADNQQDSWKKGRRNHLRGDSYRLSKLSEDNVRDIKTKRLDAKGFGRLYGVGSSNVYKIWQGKSWNHVGDHHVSQPQA